jgi:hypothetical protein
MNLQALETAIRAFLECRDGRPLTFPRPGDKETEETWLTKYVYFGPLVKELNNSLITNTERDLYNLETYCIRLFLIPTPSDRASSSKDQ